MCRSPRVTGRSLSPSARKTGRRNGIQASNLHFSSLKEVGEKMTEVRESEELLDHRAVTHRVTATTTHPLLSAHMHAHVPGGPFFKSRVAFPGVKEKNTSSNYFPFIADCHKVRIYQQRVITGQLTDAALCVRPLRSQAKLIPCLFKSTEPL